MTPEDVETEYWRVKFMTDPSTLDVVEDEDFSDDFADAMARAESGEDWETIVNEVMGVGMPERDGKVG